MVDATLFTGQPPNSDRMPASSSTNERKASSTVISESLRHTLFAVMPMAGSILRPNGYVSFMMEARSLPRAWR